MRIEPMICLLESYHQISQGLRLKLGSQYLLAVDENLRKLDKRIGNQSMRFHFSDSPMRHEKATAARTA